MLHARNDYDAIQDPRGIIPEDEPVFLLRAQDPLFADMLEIYADRQREIAGESADSMVETIREHAKLGREWPNKKDVADIPEGAEKWQSSQ